MDDTAGKPEGQDWHDTWNKNISQIDDKLVELYKNASEITGDLIDSAQDKVQNLLDKTDMDEKAAANWQKVKAEGKELGAKIEGRVQQLIAAGKIKLAGLGKKETGE